MAKAYNTNPINISTIPYDWKVMELGEMTTLLTNGFVGKAKEHYVETEGVIYIQGYNVTESGFNFNGIKKVSKSFHSKNKKSCLKEGDLVTIQTGDIGVTTIIPKELVGANCHALVISRFKVDLAYPYFFLHYFNSELGRRKLKTIETGSTMKHLNVGDMKYLQLPLPPPHEQKAIAHILNLMDTAINKNNSLIVKKELQKKWLMQNLLTGKKRLKKNGQWKTIKLGDIFEFIKSYSISRDGLTKANKEDLVYCIHYGDIHAFYETEFLDFSIQQSIPQIIDEAHIINEKDYLKEGDIIMADASEDYEGVGEVVEVVNLANKIAIGGLHTIVLRGNPEIIFHRFRGYFFDSDSVRNALRRIATGTSVYSVTKSQIYNLSFTIPDSLQEQTAIAQVLQAADKEIQLLKTKTEKLREKKKWLMQVLLTGKKRIKIK